MQKGTECLPFTLSLYSHPAVSNVHVLTMIIMEQNDNDNTTDVTLTRKTKNIKILPDRFRSFTLKF